MNEPLVYKIIKKSIHLCDEKNNGIYCLDSNVDYNYILGNYYICKNNNGFKYSNRVYYHYYMYMILSGGF